MKGSCFKKADSSQIRPSKRGRADESFKQFVGRLLGYLVATIYQLIFSVFRSTEPVKLEENAIVAVALYAGLGDAIMMMPALKMAKDYDDKLQLVVYTNEKTSFEILKLSSLIDKLFLLDSDDKPGVFTRWGFVWRNIRPFRPAIGIRSFHRNRFEDSVETYLSGAKHRIGYAESRWLSIDKVIAEAEPNQHRIEDNADLFRFLGIKDRNLAWPELPLTREDILWAKEFLGKSCEEKLVIGIHPGGKERDMVKRWPERQFAEIINLFYDHLSSEVILFGGPHDGAAIERIMKETKSCAKVAGSQSLSKTAALIKCCKVFVSNDSGLMHLAELLKIPVVGVFGPTDPVKTGPWGGGHRIITAECECTPCWSNIYHGCNNGDCMEKIDVQEVYSTVLELIRMVSRNKQMTMPKESMSAEQDSFV